MPGIDGISSLLPKAAAEAAGAIAESADIRNRLLRTRQAKEVAKGFEAVLLQKVLEGMERTIPKSGLFNDSTGEQIRGMFWQFMADEMADKGGVGLWKQIYEDIKRQTGELEPPAAVEQLR